LKHKLIIIIIIVNDIYQAICDGQTLHPDPEDQEGFIFIYFYLFIH